MRTHSIPSVSKQNDEQLLFNETSGLINSKSLNKNLIYNLFDIIVDDKYEERRKFLNTLKPQNDLRILPVLYKGSNTEIVNSLLDNMCKMGGEGIMLNLQGKSYENKRSNALLKYKQVQYCDMLVTGLYEGKGKYEGLCGGIFCYLMTEDGKTVNCEVGSGLSDDQRYDWAMNEQEIVGKIVQIGYHEMTQDRYNIGTKSYSLRFPRLISIREDKKYNEVSFKLEGIMKQKRILTKKQRIKRCNNCSKVKIIETSGTVKCRGITGGADLFIESTYYL